MRGSRRCWRNWGLISGILRGRYVKRVERERERMEKRAAACVVGKVKQSVEEHRFCPIDPIQSF